MSETHPRETLPPELADVFLRLDAYRDAVIALEDDESPQDRWDELEREAVAARAALESSLGAMVADSARLDWLDDATHQYQNPEFVMYPDGTDTYWIFTGKNASHAPREGEYGRDVRAAIDAARSPHAAPSGGETA